MSLSAAMFIVSQKSTYALREKTSGIVGSKFWRAWRGMSDAVYPSANINSPLQCKKPAVLPSY